MALSDSYFSLPSAIGCSLLYTIFYIAPFYLSATLRHTPLNSRDAPQCIRARVSAVGLTCVACSAITIILLVYSGAATTVGAITRLLGVYPFGVSDIISVLALTMVLFSCSLYERLVVDTEWRRWSLRSIKQDLWDDWRGFRNQIAAPASEELVFRSLTIPLYLGAGVTPTSIIFGTPLVFGLAHAHHLAEFIQTFTPPGSRWPSTRILMSGLARTTLQFTYTSLFGFFAAFVFLRTGNLWAAVATHSFCNYVGFPRLWGRVGQVDEEDDEEEDEEDESERSRTSNGGKTPKRSAGLIWTVVYYSLIPLGMYGFSKLLWQWTESEYALVKF